jgi:transcriptional regulator with XRE-family HTH domain
MKPTDSYIKEVAAKIKAARENKELSQADVAAQLGLTTTAYGYFERGKRTIALAYFLQLPTIFGIPITDLLPASLLSRIDRQRALDPQLEEIKTGWQHLTQPAKNHVLEAYRFGLTQSPKSEPPEPTTGVPKPP